MRRYSPRRRIFPCRETTIFRGYHADTVSVTRFLVVLLIAVWVFVLCPRSLAAQSLPLRPVSALTDLPRTISLSAEQMTAVERWMREYTSWRAWSAQWLNKREPSLFGTRERRRRPDPPGALFAACPVSVEETGVLADACRMLDEWRHDDLATEIISQQMASARKRKEADQKTVWWQHVHLDALWPMTQGTSGMFGVLGLHTTIDLTGRIELFLAPGAIVMRVPGPSGNGEWKPATDWGFSYRLADFTMPRMHRPATLHVNLAKVWFLGGSDSVPGVSNDLYLAGFSLTFRKSQTTH